MRVFLDTNIWVAAFAAHGLCETLLEECFVRHEVMTSTLVREELADVLLRKLAPKPATLKQIDALWQMATHIADAPAGHGDNDARLLHAAAAAGAEAFVTGDKAVLNLQAYQGMPILSPRQMFERLMREG